MIEDTQQEARFELAGNGELFDQFLCAFGRLRFWRLWRACDSLSSRPLTVMRLGLPDSLERVLSSTNLIENLFSRVREIGRRVRRWQSGSKL